jgi:N-acetyl-gamma-glutamyl-phosphate reductase
MIKYGSFDKFPHYVSLKKVVGTNCNFISYKIEKTASGNSKIYLFSTIDNLLKGAAGQAVENMNRYFDYPVDFGLSQLEALQ